MAEKFLEIPDLFYVEFIQSQHSRAGISNKNFCRSLPYFYAITLTHKYITILVYGLLCTHVVFL